MLRRRKVSKWVVIIFVVLFALIFGPRLIKINSIDCQSQFGPCSKVIDSQLTKIEGQSYLSAYKNITNFFKENILVSDYSIKFNLPSKLIVHIVERKPIVSLVKRSDEQKFYFIDSDGIILFTQENSQLPKVILPEDTNLEIGKKVDPGLLFASKILQGCFITFGSRLAIVTPELIEVDLPDSIRVRFPLTGDTNLLLGSLNSILSRLNMSETDSKIKLIDLRFKNPVIL